MTRTGGGMADALLWEECKRNIEIKRKRISVLSIRRLLIEFQER